MDWNKFQAEQTRQLQSYSISSDDEYVQSAAPHLTQLALSRTQGCAQRARTAEMFADNGTVLVRCSGPGSRQGFFSQRTYAIAERELLRHRQVLDDAERTGKDKDVSGDTADLVHAVSTGGADSGHDNRENTAPTTIVDTTAIHRRSIDAAELLLRSANIPRHRVRFSNGGLQCNCGKWEAAGYCCVGLQAVMFKLDPARTFVATDVASRYLKLYWVDRCDFVAHNPRIVVPGPKFVELVQDLSGLVPRAGPIGAVVVDDATMPSGRVTKQQRRDEPLADTETVGAELWAILRQAGERVGGPELTQLRVGSLISDLLPVDIIAQHNLFDAILPFLDREGVVRHVNSLGDEVEKLSPKAPTNQRYRHGYRGNNSL
jgi:hypothetical protein